MNKYIIITNESKKALCLKNKLLKLLQKNWIEDQKDFQFVFVIGGDGTFLRSIDLYQDKKIIPINGGNFGYYSFFNCNNIKDIAKQITNEKNYINPTLLEMKINKTYTHLSLNEFFIRSDTSLICKLFINNIYFEKFRGSGIILSTPFGSTGHSKSANGAVIYPNLNVIQLVEIEPIAQKEYLTLKSPLILQDDAIIKINNIASTSAPSIIVDGKPLKLEFELNEIVLKSCKASFKIFNPNNQKNYFAKLRHSFIRE